MTDEQVLQEIERLKKSDYVKLSKAYERKKYKLRQRLYTLRSHEKKGKALAEAGLTKEMLKEIE